MTGQSQSDFDPLVTIACEIVSAFVRHHFIAAADLPVLMKEVHTSLRGLNEVYEPPVLLIKPAVPVKKSVTRDYIICLDDGKKFKSLKRHLSSLGLSPDEYRAKWDLPSDYPMVAPNYSATRSALAKSNGLGRKTETQKSTRKSGRRTKSAKPITTS